MERLAERLKSHVCILADTIGERNVLRPEALRAAENYIAGQWREQGYGVGREVDWAHGIECANLEVSIPGARVPDEILLVGAHYDSVFGSPGADDNASGVAVLLELSRLFRQDAPPERGVRLVAFVNEEPPFFGGRHMGSLIYAKAAKRRGDRIRCMVSLEMLGYYDDTPGAQQYPPLLKHFFRDRGDFIALVGNLASRQPLRSLARAFRAQSAVPLETLAAPIIVPGIAASDHFSFWRQGYPALMLTDTAYYRNPWYHTGGDLPQYLCYPVFAAVARGFYLALRSYAAEGV